MAVQFDELPASSQLSSILSEPPASDNEDLGEITVESDTTTISSSHNLQPQHENQDIADMPSKLPQSDAQPKRQSQRQSKRKPLYRAQSSEDQLGKEIHVSPSVSKNTVPAKRSRPSSTTKPAPKPPAKKAKPAIDRKLKKWEPDFVIQNVKSPLVTNGVDLRTLLLQPAAWDVLSAEDKKEILSFFPADVHILDPNTPNARPNVTSLSSNDTFRHDAEEYVSNISKGMHDPEWLRQAWIAHQRRATGEFDEFYIRKVEVDWDTNIPYEHRPEHLRGVKGTPSSSISMGEVPQMGGPVANPETNGVSKNGTLKQDGDIKPFLDTSINGNKAQISDRELSNGTMDTADSITVHHEQALKRNGGPRFELIPSPAESDTELAHDSKETVKEPATDIMRTDTVETEVKDESEALKMKDSNGEIAFAGSAVEVDRVEVDGSAK